MSNLSKTQIAAIKMTLKFLEELGDVQGNAGCNDFSMENTDEHWEMYKRSVYDNGDKLEIQEFEESSRPTGEIINTYDFGMVYVCKLYLEDLLKETEDDNKKSR